MRWSGTRKREFTEPENSRRVSSPKITDFVRLLVWLAVLLRSLEYSRSSEPGRAASAAGLPPSRRGFPGDGVCPNIARFRSSVLAANGHREAPSLRAFSGYRRRRGSSKKTAESGVESGVPFVTTHPRRCDKFDKVHHSVTRGKPPSAATRFRSEGLPNWA